MGVNLGCPRRAVTREFLDHLQVPGSAPKVSQCSVTQLVDREEPIEAGPLLPLLKERAKPARGEPLVEAREEQRRRRIEGFPLESLPGEELPQLVDGVVGHDRLLMRRLWPIRRCAFGPLVLAKGEATPRRTVNLVNIANRERQQLVLAEGSS